MKEVHRMKEQLEAAYQGEAWHGPSLLESLNGLTAYQASIHSIKSAHSAREIVLHLITTNETITKRLQGIKAVPSEEEDWPEVGESSKEGWEKTISMLKESHQNLVNEVNQLTDESLNQPIVKDFSSIYRTLHGIAQHYTYHAGQIVLIRKMQGS